MEFVILALLFVKHYVGDFVIQAQYMIEEKARYGAEGGLHHAWVHGIGSWAVLFVFTDAFTASLFALADAVIHYHIDWVKMNLSKQWQPHHWAFWTWFGADQLAHALTYIGIVAILTR